MLTTILAFVIILGLLVFVHELGHFVTAKKMGVRVDEFGFGFPPRMFGIKRGGTLYSLNWIPLGGFVRIKGETGESADDPDSFAHKAAWKRLSILGAGVAMNFLLAYVLFSVGFMMGIPQEITDEDLKKYSVRDVSVVITEVAPGSPAENAGIRLGDKLASLNAVPVETPDTAVDYIQEHATEEIAVGIQRGDERVEYNLTPAIFEGTERPLLGVAMIRTGLVKYSIPRALVQGFLATITIIAAVVLAFIDLLRTLVSGGGLPNAVSGPVGVAVLTGQVAQLGFPYLINFTAILSINLGILNILPIPALDGGRMLFVIIEKIKGKPVGQKLEGIIHTTGFALLILLVIFVTFRDVAQYGGSIWEGITGLFSR